MDLGLAWLSGRFAWSAAFQALDCLADLAYRPVPLIMGLSRVFVCFRRSQGRLFDNG
jgi:hypothetical protein